jgi:FixJ family two-component response regulator
VRVLFIVEGDSAVRNLRQMMMTYLGWRVHAFASTGDCLEELRHQVPACIVSDLSPPTMSAIELRAALVARDIAVPIVAVCDLLGPSPVLLAQAAGITEVLDNPCDARRLELAIHRAIDKKKTVNPTPTTLHVHGMAANAEQGFETAVGPQHASR